MFELFKTKQGINRFLAEICGEKMVFAKRIHGSFLPDSLEGYINKVLDFTEEFFANLRTANSKVAARGINLQDDIRMIQEHLGNYVEQTCAISSATEEMSATVNEINSLTSDVQTTATRMIGVANKGNEVVAETINTMKEISEEVKHSADEIKQLGESSKTVGEVIQVIEDIADQTNLLALNAAIEAARAGEQGRGFAVVADEVRKLAERTTLATAEIGKIIKDIQTSTVTAVKMMDQNVKKVEAGTASTDSADRALDDILNEAKALESMIVQINSATEQHQQATMESAESVEKLLTGVQMTEKRLKDDTLPYINETLAASQETDSLFSRVVVNDKALIRIAIEDHLLWLERINNMLHGKIRLLPNPVMGDHTKCRLGKWYFSEEHDLSLQNPKARKAFEELDRPHKRVHEIFLQIINAYNDGDEVATRRLDEDLRNTSKEIVGKLEELERVLEE